MRGHIAKKGNKYYIVVDLGRDHKNRRRQKWFSGYDREKEAGIIESLKEALELENKKR